MSSPSSPELEPRPSAPAEHRVAALLEAGAPALLWVLLLAMVAAWGVDLPYWDQWMMVPLFEKALDGTLSPGDLAPRYHGTGALTKAVLLLVGLASDWNIRLELLLNLLVAAALYRVVHARLREERLAPPSSAAATLLFALLIFSPAQQENWAWGWKLETWINVLAATLAIVLLGSGRPTARRLAAALLCGIAATHSYINGVLVWPLGAIVLALRGDASLRTRLLPFGVWMGASAFFVSVHLRAYGYSASGLAGIPLDATATLRYVCTFLGAPLAHDLGSAAPHVSALLGASGLLSLVVCLASRAAWTASVPVLVWPAVAAYAVGTAAMAALVRVSLGVEQALSSRYLTYANLFWIGLVGSLAAASRPRLDARGPTRAGPGAARARRSRSTVVVSLALAVPVGLQALAEVPGYRDQSTRAEFRGSLRLGVIDELHLPYLYPDPVLLEDYVSRLCRRRLSLFRHLRELDPAGDCRPSWRRVGEPNPIHGVVWTAVEPTRDGEVLRTARGFGAPIRPSGVVGVARRVTRPDGRRCLAGSAVDRRRLEPAPALAVVVLLDGRVVRTTLVDDSRPAVADALRIPTDRIGFRVCLEASTWAEIDAGAELRVLGVSAHGVANDLELRR
jgi:hypothetical protein